MHPPCSIRLQDIYGQGVNLRRSYLLDVGFLEEERARETHKNVRNGGDSYMPFVYSFIFSFNQKKVVDEECVCKCSTVYKIPKGRCTNWPPSLIDGNLRHSIQKGVCLQQFLKENECFLALPTGSYIYQENGLQEDPELFGLYHTRLGTKQGRTLWMTLLFVTISG
jgi:hypothetical protein